MASSRSSASSPPPYEEQPRAFLSLLQQRCARICEWEVQGRTSTTPSRAHVERLKRFLRYILIVDYSLDHDAYGWYIDCEDARVFLRMVGFITDMRTLGPEAEQDDPTAVRACAITVREIINRVRDPARQLGVPPDVAIAMLLRWADNLDAGGGYKGCLDALCNSRHSQDLERKLIMDEALVIPAVITLDEPRLRYRLMDAAAAELDLVQASEAGKYRSCGKGRGGAAYIPPACEDLCALGLDCEFGSIAHDELSCSCGRSTQVRVDDRGARGLLVGGDTAYNIVLKLRKGIMRFISHLYEMQNVKRDQVAM